jgi:NADH dehydrogenase
MERKHRVVVIGGGFGGLAAAKALREAPVDVVVVDANNFHTFQPLLYQVATAGLDSDNVAYSIRGIIRGARNTSFRQARVVGVDLDARVVTVDHGQPLEFDSLVLAAGAVSHDFGTPGVEQFGFPLKNLEDALDIRVHLLDVFERAMVEPALIADGALNVVVAGGGPTGVEMAGGIMELYSHVLEKDFPTLPVRHARVVLVEMADRLLTPFTAKSSARALRTLERRGVEVRLGVGVQRLEATRVHLSDGSVIAAHTTVWAAGVRANPLAEALGVPLTRGGRVVVESDLSVPGHPNVYVIGDLAASPDVDGAPLPQVAQPAIQGGKHVAKQIVHRLHGEPTTPFRYRDKGQMATIGRLDAVTELANGWRFGGPLGWVSWLGLHLVYLMGFRNRVNVFINWAWNYLTYDRGSRLLPESRRKQLLAATDQPPAITNAGEQRAATPTR